MSAAGDTIYEQFTTHDASTGALADADSTPTGTLVKNGTDTAVTVIVTKKATGTYTAQFTIPSTYVAGDEVALRINATIGGTATGKVVWQESLASGAATAAEAGDYATELVTIRDQLVARIKEITESPKPSYNVNGQQIGWTEYLDSLMDKLAKINALIAAGEPDTGPWEETMQVF